MTDEKKEHEVCLDKEQVRALVDLEKITTQSISDMVREGIELYIRFKKSGTSSPPQPTTMLSPIIFEPPYRKQ